MKSFCDCNQWLGVKDYGDTIFQEDPNYGWVLHWVELTEEEGFTQVHRYGIPIAFCPMCGQALKNTIKD